MFFKNIVLSTLAVAGLAHAQTPRECREDKVEIKSQADLDAIQSCKTLAGDLNVGKGVVNLDLSFLEKIGGNFVIEDTGDMISINMPLLQSIAGEFRMTELIRLNNLNCPQLSTVGSINWVKLPELRSLSFGQKVTQADSIIISDTKLESLEGIDLRTVRRFRLDNNKQLKSVKVGLKNVSEELALVFNSKSMSVELPELIWAANLTIRDASSIALPKLAHINGTLSFDSNSVKEIEVKNLQDTGALAVIGNTELTDLQFPKLTVIAGAFKIYNNTELTQVTGFPELQEVRGAIDFSGNFENATLPKLEDVQGGFHLQTSAEIDCSEFEEYQGSVIQGDDFTCEGKLSNPESKDGESNAGNGNGNGNKDEDKKDAAGRLTAGSILGLTMAVAFVVAF